MFQSNFPIAAIRTRCNIFGEQKMKETFLSAAFCYLVTMLFYFYIMIHISHEGDRYVGLD